MIGAGGHDDPDLRLEEALREAAALLDPVPSDLVQFAVDAYALRSLEGELAELTFDSLAGPQPVRGDDQPRLATFHAEGVTVDVEITVDGGAVRVLGQVIPARPSDIEIHRAHGHPPVVVVTDALGRFACDQVPAGPFSLRCRTGGTVVVTEWITV